jgi:hypothetical protein
MFTTRIGWLYGQGNKLFENMRYKIERMKEGFSGRWCSCHVPVVTAISSHLINFTGFALTGP